MPITLAEADQHVRDAEDRVAAQAARLKRLDAARWPAEARSARELLAVLTDSLSVARRLREIVGGRPPAIPS